ncbi:DUF2690 domain-containing protein [Streptomyces sp. URMC 123]|uniref:DUF2690 domain-containing protein n=1 Tax=Streptomyces sp. URMC 123 TaxID=3423403 RepID=UPI003F1CDEDA
MALTGPDERRTPAARPSAQGPAGQSPPGVVVPSAPPSPGCRGAACAGKDPQSMACGRVVSTLASHVAAGGAHVEIRYSADCAAAWGRIWRSRVGDRIEITAPGGAPQIGTVADEFDAAGYLYTRMVAAEGGGAAVRACVREAARAEPECFAP